jgi:hypothetical protein
MDPADPLLRLAALGLNDARTPLATLRGYARTLAAARLDEPHAGYARTVEESAAAVTAIVDELALVVRIAEARWEPACEPHGTRALAEEVAARFDPGRVVLAGDEGAEVIVDRDPAARALTALVRAAMRHGGLDDVRLAVIGPVLRLAPLEPNARPVLLGDAVRDFGAGAALRVLAALGGTVEGDGDGLEIRLPARSAGAPERGTAP